MYNWSERKAYILLHLLLFLYSISGVCSKLAAAEPFFSFRYCLYYAAVISLLGVYAAGWQQVLKHLPLTAAYANKAVTVLWGLLWGNCLFHEPVTAGKAVGALLVAAGVAVGAGTSEGVQEIREGSDDV